MWIWLSRVQVPSIAPSFKGPWSILETHFTLYTGDILYTFSIPKGSSTGGIFQEMSGYFKFPYFLTNQAIVISLCLCLDISRYFNLWLHGATYLATWILRGWPGASLEDKRDFRPTMLGIKILFLTFLLFDTILLDSYPRDLRMTGHEATLKVAFVFLRLSLY